MLGPGKKRWLTPVMIKIKSKSCKKQNIRLDQRDVHISGLDRLVYWYTSFSTLINTKIKNTGNVRLVINV